MARNSSNKRRLLGERSIIPTYDSQQLGSCSMISGFCKGFCGFYLLITPIILFDNFDKLLKMNKNDIKSVSKYQVIAELQRKTVSPAFLRFLPKLLGIQRSL